MEAFAAWLVVWAKTRAVGWLARHWPKLVAAVLTVGGAAVFVAVTAATLVSGTDQDAVAANACTELGYLVDDAAYQPLLSTRSLLSRPAGPSPGSVETMSTRS